MVISGILEQRSKIYFYQELMGANFLFGTDVYYSDILLVNRNR